MPLNHHVRVYASGENLARTDELAWKLAEVAADPSPTSELVPEPVAQMVANRLIDDAAVAAASLTRSPIAAARAQAVAHPVAPTPPPHPYYGLRTRTGAAVFGLDKGIAVSPEWAAWANGVAVRELDFHDTYLAAEYAHPGDTIPPLLAVAQHMGIDGAMLTRAIATAYEIQVSLSRGISLHAHAIDHVAHLGPAVAAGIGTLLSLDTATIHQAIGQALHTTTATRQSRKGQISTWKAYAPAFAGKAAVEAIDRAMRGQTSPEPIYEGADAVIARLLDGPDGAYDVVLPEEGEPREAILDTFTKAHSAEYQAQAFIDLAIALHTEFPWLADPANIRSITVHTSQHTHNVIGSGASDPQKYDPTASRETLDHSLPYILTVALQDGSWDHEGSYTPQRAGRQDTVALWQLVSTTEEARWTTRYHSGDPGYPGDSREKAFGGSLEIDLADGGKIVREIAVADAHPLGAKPYAREDYLRKFRALAVGQDKALEAEEADRFCALAEQLPDLTARQVRELAFTARPGWLDESDDAVPPGLFR